MAKSDSEEAYERMIARLSNRLADALEVLRRWEPDYASAEDQQLLYFAHEARRDARAILAGRSCMGPCFNEQRRDKAIEGLS